MPKLPKNTSNRSSHYITKTNNNQPYLGFVSILTVCRAPFHQDAPLRFPPVSRSTCPICPDDSPKRPLVPYRAWYRPKHTNLWISALLLKRRSTLVVVTLLLLGAYRCCNSKFYEHLLVDCCFERCCLSILFVVMMTTNKIVLDAVVGGVVMYYDTPPSVPSQYIIYRDTTVFCSVPGFFPPFLIYVQIRKVVLRQSLFLKG